MSIHKLLFFIAVNIATTSAVMAQVTFKGKIENVPITAVNKIAVEYFSDDRWLEMDKIELAADKSFQKTITGNHGQARLRMWGQAVKWIDFIMPLSSSDTVLDFGTIDYNYIDGNPAKLKSKEGEAYYLLLTDYKKYRVLRDSIAKSDSLPASAKAQLNKQLEKATTELNERCKETSANNKGTLTGDIIANLLYVPVKNDYSFDKKITSLSQEDFEREHLIDRLPMGDKRSMLHNGLVRALNNYFNKFPKADLVYSQMFIDKVMSRRRSNEEVNDWLFRYLLLKSVGNRDDASITYLLKWYSPYCSVDEISVDASTKTLLNALNNCEVGTRAFNLSLPDSSGKLMALADIAAQNKLTLLFFWRSDCQHCREFEPELATLYKKYKPLGLEVIGISIDAETTSWKKYLSTTPMEWINLHPSTNQQRGYLNKNFPVPGTPTLIALDKNYVVKSRLVVRATLEKYLQQELEH